MRNKKSALAALAVLVVVALSGCVRFQAQLTVSPNDTVNGTIVAAALVGDEADSRKQAESIATQIEEQLLPGLRGAPGVTATVYDEDNHLGTKFNFTDTPLDAFSSESFALTRDGEEFVFSGALDFTPDQDDVAPESDADTSNITVSIYLPGSRRGIQRRGQRKHRVVVDDLRAVDRDGCPGQRHRIRPTDLAHRGRRDRWTARARPRCRDSDQALA